MDGQLLRATQYVYGMARPPRLLMRSVCSCRPPADCAALRVKLRPLLSFHSCCTLGTAPARGAGGAFRAAALGASLAFAAAAGSGRGRKSGVCGAVGHGAIESRSASSAAAAARAAGAARPPPSAYVASAASAAARA